MQLTIVIFVYFYIVPCRGQTSDNVKNLTIQLFETNKYRKNVRPNLDLTKPMKVDLDFILMGINGIDEITQKLTTTGYLYVAWTDEYLQWDSATYGEVVDFYVSQSDVWKPDITLQNGFTKLKELGNSFIHVHIFNTGSVTWWPFEVFETKCDIDIKFFPFDQQTCDIIFVVWSSSIADVNVTKGTNGIILNDVSGNGIWSVVSTSASQDVESFESRVVFKIVLKRSSTYYVLNVIIPVVLLGILNIFTFVLPADSGEKMGYTITVFLSFAVFLTIVSAELPKTSGSILGYYLMFQLSMGSFVVIITAIELRFHHKKEPVAPKVLRVFKWNCKSAVSSSDDGEKNTKKGDNTNGTELSWCDIISRVDGILFCCTFIIDFVVTMAVFIVLSKH